MTTLDLFGGALDKCRPCAGTGCLPCPVCRCARRVAPCVAGCPIFGDPGVCFECDGPHARTCQHCAGEGVVCCNRCQGTGNTPARPLVLNFAQAEE